MDKHACPFLEYGIAFILLVSLQVFPCTSFAEQEMSLFREEFVSLTHWQPFLFPKIEQHSIYTTAQINGISCLQAESNSSASGIIYDREYDVYAWPVLKWRWKVTSVYKNGNALTKAGDDYPLRIYILFEYDHDKANLWDRVKYSSAKLFYGQYPPHSSLNYIWANRRHKNDIITNSYTDRAMLILMESGRERLGTWREYTVNILDDYKRAFGENPPAAVRIAIMNDSDNTGEKSLSYVDYVEVSK